MAADFTPHQAQRTFLKKGVNGLRLHAAVGCLRVVAACKRFPRQRELKVSKQEEKARYLFGLEGNKDLPEGMPKQEN